jgi:TonB family protein
MVSSSIALMFGASALAPAFSGPIVRHQDYPERSLRKNETGAQRIELVVEPSGHVRSCRILIPSRHAELDDAACKAAKRAKARPATDRAGQALPGIIRMWVAWMINGVAKSPIEADTILHVSRLPLGVEEPAIATLTLVVSATGRTESCEVERSSGSAARTLSPVGRSSALLS